MRTVAVVAVSALALTGSLAGAEARGFRLRSLGHTSSISAPPVGAAPRSTRTSGGVATVGAISLPVAGRTEPVSLLTTQAQAPDETAPIPPMPPAPVLAAKKPAEPWCRSGRVAGSGEGFCLMN